MHSKWMMAASFTALFCLGAAAAPANADTLTEQCANTSSPDVSIAACTTLLKGASNNPETQVAYSNLGTAYLYKGDLDNSIRYLNLAIAHDPNDSSALVNRCVVYRQKSMYNLALPDCQHGLQVDLSRNSKETWVDYNTLGLVYVGLGDQRLAIASFDEALKQTTHAAEILHNRATAKRQFGDIAGAEADEALAQQAGTSSGGPAPLPASASYCNAATGDWAWFIGGVVTLSADGTVSGRLYRGSPQVLTVGAWRCNGNLYTITWSNGFIDRLRLSDDGRRLAGRNMQGIRVSGTRL